MSLVQPDFTEVTDPIEPGEYRVRVNKGEPGQWEKDGRVTKYINFEMETFDEEDPKNNGRKVWDRVPITGKGAFRIQDFYKACTGETLTKESGGFDIEQLVGKELAIVLEQNGQYTNVKTYKTIQ